MSGADGPGRDYLIHCLRGDATSDLGYELIAAVRQLWRNGHLADREIISALAIGDNRCLDDARRWTEPAP